LPAPDIGAPISRVMRGRGHSSPPEQSGFFERETLGFLLERVLGLETLSSDAPGRRLVPRGKHR
jgi:hypothetical protein